MNTSSLAGGATGLAIAAALLYLFLRLLAATPGRREPRDSAASHALWTAVIAFFASSTSGLQELLVLHAPTLVQAGTESQYVQATSDQSTLSMALAAASPGLWLGLVYVLAQFTWPRPTARVRQASLEVRTLKDHLPPVLSSAFVAMSTVALAAVVWAWTSPGSDPVPGRNLGGDAATNDLVAVDGLRPGTEASPWLLAGLLLVVAAIWLAASVIVRRRPLNGLSDDENHTIRLIGLNRLLRTGILVAGGFLLAAASSAIAELQHGALASGEWHDRGGIFVGAAKAGTDLPWGWLVMVLFVGQFAVFVAMAAAAPPRLLPPGDSRTQSMQAHLPGTLVPARLLLNRCHGWALALAMLPLVALLLTLYQVLGGSSRWPAPSFDGLEAPLVAASLPFAFYFLAMLGAEALLRRGHCPPSGPRTASADDARPPAPKYALFVAAGLYAVVLALSLSTPDSDRALVFSISVGLALAAVPAALWWVLVNRRPDLGRSSASQDARMRTLSRHRILRLAAAALFMGTALIVLMDSSFWHHWGGGVLAPQSPEGWPKIRWLCGDGLLALSLLSMFLPSAEFSRAAPAAGPPNQVRGETTDHQAGGGSRA